MRARAVQVWSTGGTPQKLGTMVDDGQTEPYGSNDAIDQMLVHPDQTRRQRFEHYAAGWSNAYLQTKAV